MPAPQATSAAERRLRKQRGDFPTPVELVDQVVERALGAIRPGQRLRVLDPACGDGRFLVAAGRRIRAAGGHAELHGVDVHPAAVAAAREALAADGFAGQLGGDDARTRDWSGECYDAVVGNPPYLSQLAAATTRGRASSLGGGPYADAAAEFLALAVRLIAPGGRVGLVLPQSILASRDAGPVRELVDREATRIWSWWSPRRLFDAEVLVCALVFQRCPAAADGPRRPWTDVVTEALGVPPLPPLAAAGPLGHRALITANFRDQYSGLVGAVHEAVSPADAGDEQGAGGGPPLITSGLIDPARCWWGERPVRFAGRSYERPQASLDALTPKLRRWGDSLLVPKVLVANQTTVVEAVADDAGAWLPAVPVITLRPADTGLVRAIAAVLTSPVASCWAWHQAAGTGLAARSLRLGPRWLARLPWPAGDLDAVVAAYTAGDVIGCGRAVQRAYGQPDDDALMGWWIAAQPDRR